MARSIEKPLDLKGCMVYCTQSSIKSKPKFSLCSFYTVHVSQVGACFRSDLCQCSKCKVASVRSDGRLCKFGRLEIGISQVKSGLFHYTYVSRIRKQETAK